MKKKTDQTKTPVDTNLDPEAVPQYVEKAPVETEVSLSEETVEETAAVETQETAPEPKQKIAKARGRKYVAARSRVDKTKAYELTQAIELVKSMSYSKFDGSIEAHLVLREEGISATVTFPHTTGKKVRAAIVSEELLADLDKGIIDFDILIAKPEDMKKIAKYARVLGPKGLMPNPKSGTVTPNPEAKKAALEGGAVTVKTERKAPLAHVVVGKVSSKTEDVQANIDALLKAFANKIIRLNLTATMSPSVRVQI